MTEYWKSQARKYCEFCKCWFADNKVSISFHESGKRHKEHVQKHISQLSKKSAKEFKQKEKLDDDLKKMETAAMAAYMKDVQNNADITSQEINEILTQACSDERKPIILTVNNVPVSKAPPIWHEVKSEDGSSYFWNKETNDTVWDTPDEYLSIADQEKEKLKGEEIEKKRRKQKHREDIKEVKAHIAREQMRELAVSKDQPPASTYTEYGPAPCRTQPYGTWRPVVHDPEEKLDFQLPTPDKKVVPPPVVMVAERIQFKEKRVESLGDGPVEFKKRKLNNPKRNMRQKIDDD